METIQGDGEPPTPPNPGNVFPWPMTLRVQASWVRSAAGLCGEAWAVEFQAWLPWLVRSAVIRRDRGVWEGKGHGYRRWPVLFGGYVLRTTSRRMMSRRSSDTWAAFRIMTGMNSRPCLPTRLSGAIRLIINTKAFDKFMVELQEMMK